MQHIITSVECASSSFLVISFVIFSFVSAPCLPCFFLTSKHHSAEVVYTVHMEAELTSIN